MVYFALKMQFEHYMRRCLQLAENGAGYTAPNPMVGAVIVRNGKIIGEGWHRAYGEPHAEINAIAAVTDPTQIAGSTIYVSLEPCSHFGKTPPCADALIKHDFSEVVVAMRDPNPAVAGRGLARIREAGISVHEDVLRSEAEFLNRRFITLHTRKRPFVLLKWAETADGFMDKLRDKETDSGINWISHPQAKKLVHLWRSRESAILVGRRTIVNDDPELTNRLTSGPSPLRIVLSRSGEIPPNAKILNDGKPVWIFNERKAEKRGGAEWIRGEGDLISFCLKELALRGIASVMVEGGKEILNAFIARGLWDEARIIRSDLTFGTGLTAPRLNRAASGNHRYGPDTVQTFYNNTWST